MMQTSRRRWLRSLLVAAIALAAVIGGALWWLGAQFPSERLRPLIADQVQQRTGREFAIRGPLAIRLLPRIAVVADDVVLGNATWGSRREMLSVGRARLAVAIGPLLRGRLVVSEVALDRVDLLLETDRRGAGNWVFDAAGRPAAEPAAGEGAALQVAVEQVQLRDARVTWRDGRSGTSRVVDLAMAELEPDGATARLAAQLRLESTAWTIDGRIGRLEDLGATQADWPIELRATAAGAELALAGQLKAGSAPRTLAAAASATLTKPEALAPWTTAAVPLPLSLQARVEARAGSLTADELKLSVAGQALTGRATVATEGTPRVDVQLAARSIDLGRWLPAAT
ncbi:MAG: AsmA family protein, partial [Burkholderiales bacterium]|nr:AsmA family protein [Burkholderiales bacterium]